MVAAVARLPALAAQPAWEHAFRIYETWQLDRTSPLAIALGALWAGAALALLRRFVRRTGLLLALLVVWSAIELLGGLGFVRRLDPSEPVTATRPAAWLPLPLLPAAVVYLLARRAGAGDRLAWAAAGLSFGLLLAAFWVAPRSAGLPLALLAAPLAVAGAAIGRWTYGMLERPARAATWALIAAVGLVWPFLTGLVDLYLRRVTP
jgi:hypothetical protein